MQTQEEKLAVIGKVNAELAKVPCQLADTGAAGEVNAGLLVARHVERFGSLAETDLTTDSVLTVITELATKLKWVVAPPKVLLARSGQSPDVVQDREDTKRANQAKGARFVTAVEQAAQDQAEKEIDELLINVREASPVKTEAKQREYMAGMIVLSNGKVDNLKTLSRLKELIVANRKNTEARTSFSGNDPRGDR